jgi:hypothetical protein
MLHPRQSYFLPLLSLRSSTGATNLYVIVPTTKEPMESYYTINDMVCSIPLVKNGVLIPTY